MTDVLRQLDPLVGRWEATAGHPAHPDLAVSVTVTFEWHEGVYLLQRTAMDHPDFPNSVTIVGADDTTGRFSACYTDDRDVQRVYEMSMADGVWRQWRDVEGFAQRFTGTFSEDGNTIDGAWELCTDGETWSHDFGITYRRLNGPA